LRSTLVINDMLMSENVIVIEIINNILYIISRKNPMDITPHLFYAFDTINKLNGNLFHFGKCTKLAHNSEDKVVDLLRDSTIYVSIYLRVIFIKVSEEDVMFYVTKNQQDTISKTLREIKYQNIGRYSIIRVFNG